MMRKTFNTQLINAGMPEEIREHFRGHVYKDKVRDAYFLADADELLKVYLKYIDNVKLRREK
jgi:integrase